MPAGCPVHQVDLAGTSMKVSALLNCTMARLGSLSWFRQYALQWPERPAKVLHGDICIQCIGHSSQHGNIGLVVTIIEVQSRTWQVLLRDQGPMHHKSHCLRPNGFMVLGKELGYDFL